VHRPTVNLDDLGCHAVPFAIRIYQPRRPQDDLTTVAAGGCLYGHAEMIVASCAARKKRKEKKRLRLSASIIEKPRIIPGCPFSCAASRCGKSKVQSSPHTPGKRLTRQLMRQHVHSHGGSLLLIHTMDWLIHPTQGSLECTEKLCFCR